MSSRPYVLLSAAMSADGCLDDRSATRLLLSSPADLERVDELRSGCDAILVGATTIRRDDPRLLVRSSRLQEHRRFRGLPAQPAKVTLTASGDLDPAAQFFTAGSAEKLVYASSPAAARSRPRLRDRATVVDLGARIDLGALLADLADRGVGRLLVEGGGRVNAQFLAADLVDEIQVAIAPFFVGDAAAPRFVEPDAVSVGSAGGQGAFPQNAAHRMELAEVRPVGDVALLRWLPRRPAPGAIRS